MSKVEKNRGRVYFSVHFGASAWPKKTGISTGAKNRDYTLLFFDKNILKRKLKLAKFEAEI